MNVAAPLSTVLREVFRFRTCLLLLLVAVVVQDTSYGFSSLPLVGPTRKRRITLVACYAPSRDKGMGGGALAGGFYCNKRDKIGGR